MTFNREHCLGTVTLEKDPQLKQVILVGQKKWCASQCHPRLFANHFQICNLVIERQTGYFPSAIELNSFNL